jgi:hypothetical protein
VQFLKWQDQAATGIDYWLKWYDSYAGSVTTLESGKNTTVLAAAYGDFVAPENTQTFYNDITHDPNNADWVHTAFEFKDFLPAAVGCYEMPALADRLAIDQEQVTAGDVAVNQVIRGYDASEDFGSLGTLMHLIGSGADTHESMEMMSRRWYFQWGHPVGVYYQFPAGAGTTVNMFSDNAGDYTFLTNPRNLVESTNDIEAYPVLVLSNCAADVDFVFTAQVTGDTWTYNTGAGIGATPTLVKYTQGTGATYGANRGLEINGDGEDQIKVTATNPNPSNQEEITLHTAGLFESNPWAQ